MFSFLIIPSLLTGTELVQKKEWYILRSKKMFISLEK